MKLAPNSTLAACSFAVTMSLASGTAAFAQSQPIQTTSVSTANQFNEVFITAGYSAAFGAATAAALLVFFPNPEQNLKFVLGGGAAGFVAGGLYGFYRMNHQYGDTQNDYPGSDDFGPLPPSQPLRSSLSLAPARAPRGALFNASTQAYGFDVPQFALAPNTVAIHLVQIRY